MTGLDDQWLKMCEICSRYAYWQSRSKMGTPPASHQLLGNLNYESSFSLQTCTNLATSATKFHSRIGIWPQEIQIFTLKFDQKYKNVDFCTRVVNDSAKIAIKLCNCQNFMSDGNIRHRELRSDIKYSTGTGGCGGFCTCTVKNWPKVNENVAQFPKCQVL